MACNQINHLPKRTTLRQLRAKEKSLSNSIGSILELQGSWINHKYDLSYSIAVDIDPSSNYTLQSFSFPTIH
jgi:hypothetical protein